MRAVLVVVANILTEQAFQVAFVNCDDVIQEITPATTYPTFCNPILPRTFERRADGIHPHRTAAGTSSPYLASRSKMMNLGADPIRRGWQSASEVERPRGRWGRDYLGSLRLAMDRFSPRSDLCLSAATRSGSSGSSRPLKYLCTRPRRLAVRSVLHNTGRGFDN